MNKVIQANLGGLAFTFDDAAYDLLDDYLAALDGYFRGTPGHADVDEVSAEPEPGRCLDAHGNVRDRRLRRVRDDVFEGGTVRVRLVVELDEVAARGHDEEGERRDPDQGRRRQGGSRKGHGHECGGTGAGRLRGQGGGER